MTGAAFANITERARDQGKRPPTEDTVIATAHLMHGLIDVGLKPDHLALDADGGLTLYWFGSDGYALLALDNDGDIVVGAVHQ